MKLSKRKILIGIILLLILIGGIWFFAFLNSQQREEIAETTRNLFPFGEVSINNGNQTGNNQGTIGGENGEGVDEQGTIDITDPESEGPRLRRISDFPTGGFTPITRTEKKEITDIEVDKEGNTIQTIKTIDVENQYVRYSEIKDANIHESAITPSEIVSEMLVENFIPNAEFAYFTPDGDRAFFQYWNKEDRVPETYVARLEKIIMEIEPCPFEFKTVTVDEDSAVVLGIHKFLNRIPQTRISLSGTNSPGNESSLATELTLTAIKNFQSLYQIDIDGKIGPSTKAKMQEICGQQQEKIAKEAFAKLEHKYTISGFFLPQNIYNISINPEGTKVFYTREDNLGIIGIVRNLLNDTKETIFESPFTEWLAQWNNKDSIEITTKPSYGVDGFSYYLNPDTGRYFKSLPEKKGLTTLASPDNKNVLIMESLDNTIRMSIHNRESNRTRPIIIQTFVEKCTWSADSSKLYCAVPNSLAYGGEYPDIWYQGLESYTDSLWEITIEDFQENVLTDISTDYGEVIDVQNIAVDSKNEYLYFIDINTENLWSYRLVDF